MKGKVFDIRAKQLQQASPILSEALSVIFDKYGLNICLTLMMWYTAKGVYYSELSTEEQAVLIDRCKKSLDSSYLLIDTEHQDSDEDLN